MKVDESGDAEEMKQQDAAGDVGGTKPAETQETAESGGAPDSPRADDTLIAMDIQHKTENTDDDPDPSLLAVWKQHIAEKYETYSDVLPHLFDTASDVGAIIEF